MEGWRIEEKNIIILWVFFSRRSVVPTTYNTVMGEISVAGTDREIRYSAIFATHSVGRSGSLMPRENARIIHIYLYTHTQKRSLLIIF